MKGVIIYYSGSGNTRLVCQYLTRNVNTVDWALFDITKDQGLQLSEYDVVGFATFADYLAPPVVFRKFIAKLPRQEKKAAFIFNTYGNFNGGTLHKIAHLVRNRGFTVIAGHALHMPENHPDMIKNGLANIQAPDEKELSSFNVFVNRLKTVFKENTDLKKATKFRAPFFERILPSLPRFVGRIAMDKKFVNKESCNKCGLCVNNCPYKAIEMKDYPAFNEKQCGFCWACYNHCPSKAIYTKRFRGVFHYPEPITAVKEKLPLI
jgi:ferredoxin